MAAAAKMISRNSKPVVADGRNGSHLQTDLFTPEIIQKFEAWKSSPGGAQVMRIAYAITARYANRFIRTGRRVSIRLIWETLRDNIHFIRARMKEKKIMLEKMDGFMLNDHFHAHVARHIMSRRPEWDGLFETRELGHTRKSRKSLVVEEPISKAA
jgi:hypothetical protein